MLFQHPYCTAAYFSLGKLLNTNTLRWNRTNHQVKLGKIYANNSIKGLDKTDRYAASQFGFREIATIILSDEDEESLKEAVIDKHPEMIL